MVKLKFIYMKNNYLFNLTKDDLTIKNILNKFASIIGIEIKQLYFIYKGKYVFLNNNKKINELKDNNLIIFVFNLSIKKKII